jgi:hypothetical protein
MQCRQRHAARRVRSPVLETCLQRFRETEDMPVICSTAQEPFVLVHGTDVIGGPYPRTCPYASQTTTSACNAVNGQNDRNGLSPAGIFGGNSRRKIGVEFALAAKVNRLEFS